jgi:hypothetical protein
MPYKPGEPIADLANAWRTIPPTNRIVKQHPWAKIKKFGGAPPHLSDLHLDATGMERWDGSKVE